MSLVMADARADAHDAAAAAIGANLCPAPQVVGVNDR